MENARRRTNTYIARIDGYWYGCRGEQRVAGPFTIKRNAIRWYVRKHVRRA